MLWYLHFFLLTFYLSWHICSLGPFLSPACLLPLLPAPFVAFILGKDMPSAHTTHTHKHTQVSSLFLSLPLCVCVSSRESSLESRVASLVCSLEGIAGLSGATTHNRNCDSTRPSYTPPYPALPCANCANSVRPHFAIFIGQMLHMTPPHTHTHSRAFLCLWLALSLSFFLSLPCCSFYL